MLPTLNASMRNWTNCSLYVRNCLNIEASTTRYPGARSVPTCAVPNGVGEFGTVGASTPLALIVAAAVPVQGRLWICTEPVCQRAALDGQLAVLVGTCAATVVRGRGVAAADGDREAGVQNGIHGHLPATNGPIDEAVDVGTVITTVSERDRIRADEVGCVTGIEGRHTVIAMRIVDVLRVDAWTVDATDTEVAGVVGHVLRPGVVEGVLQAVPLTLAQLDLHGVVVRVAFSRCQVNLAANADEAIERLGRRIGRPGIVCWLIGSGMTRCCATLPTYPIWNVKRDPRSVSRVRLYC